jgi:hypothetical protein
MSLKQPLLQQFQQFVATGAGPFQLDVPVEGGRLTAAIRTIDRLACVVDSLELASDKLANLSMDELKARSNRLCAKLSYLLEPIALIESDADTCTTQLRSNPPAKEDDQTFYYEILMRRGGTISLCRYQKQPGDVRQNVPATFTHEVLVRLADDFVAALD